MDNIPIIYHSPSRIACIPSNRTSYTRTYKLNDISHNNRLTTQKHMEKPIETYRTLSDDKQWITRHYSDGSKIVDQAGNYERKKISEISQLPKKLYLDLLDIIDDDISERYNNEEYWDDELIEEFLHNNGYQLT